MIEVIAQPDGFSGEEVERYVTIPLEVGLSGIPHMVHMRSQSLFGLSDVKCYFDWNITYEQARQEVLNRLGAIALPANVQPSISPWNAVGEVFRYTLEGEGYSLAQLKAAEDFVLERQWRRVPGVTDVHCPPANNGTTLMIQLKQTYRGQAKQAAAAIWGSSSAWTLLKISRGRFRYGT